MAEVGWFRMPVGLACLIVAAGLAAGPTASHAEGSPEAQGDRFECFCSMVQLIASPERYDGKRVRTMGVARVGFEETGVFLSRGAAENYVFVNGIRISTDLQLNNLHLRWVLIEGRFHKPPSGSTSWRGYIDEVKYLYAPEDVEIK